MTYPSFFAVSQWVVLQVGQIFGIPGLRGYHTLPHRLHWWSVITSMHLTYAYVEVMSLHGGIQVVAREHSRGGLVAASAFAC